MVTLSTDPRFTSFYNPTEAEVAQSHILLKPEARVIFLFGASCSGKSTLGKALQKSLGSAWTYIDRDDLIEQGECTDLTANEALDKRIESSKSRVIIDAQTPWRTKRKGRVIFSDTSSSQSFIRARCAEN